MADQLTAIALGFKKVQMIAVESPMSEEVLETFLKQHPAIENIELVVTDPSGIARGKWAPVSALKKAFKDGINFPLSLHGLDVWGNEVMETGLHISSGDKDGFFKAVPSSLSAVPWGHENAASGKATRAQVLLETFDPDGERFGSCARMVLRRAVDRLDAMGLTAVTAFELEFHLLKPESEWRDGQYETASAAEFSDAQRMYGLDALAEKSALFADIRLAAQWADLPLDTIVKEAAPGQFEINLNHRADALRAADDVVLLKRIVSESARKHGLVATFMAKPFPDQPGNGMHVHASLLDASDANIFSGSAGTEKLHHCVAGLLASMNAATLIFINTKNGFRRMAPGSYAPTRANWGENNRSVAVRLPAAPDSARRIEHRVSGADANPYLVLATLLQAIANGLEAQETPPPQLEGNAYDEATANRGPALPNTMDDALTGFKVDPFITQALGPEMAHTFYCLKSAELGGFLAEMTPLERRTYI